MAMSISSALFSDSQSRVLRWVFGLPDRAFHLSELRRLTGLGSASLQRELNALAEAHLVRSERVGNLRRFQANADSVVNPMKMRIHQHAREQRPEADAQVGVRERLD